MGRREFLTGRFRRRSESSAAGAESAPAVSVAAPFSLPIGRIADHPVGGLVRIPGTGIEVESLTEGLRARILESGAFAAIRCGMAGILVADPGEVWPDDRVYSVLINGPVRLDAGNEEGR
jgi:hypothetical protein